MVILFEIISILGTEIDIRYFVSSEPKNFRYITKNQFVSFVQFMFARHGHSFQDR